MSRDWYLIQKPPVYSSGFEDGDFEFYARDGFEDLSGSFLGSDVYLYGTKATGERRKIRAIVQNTVSDNQNNTDVRQVLCRPGTLQCGQYLRFESAWWLVASMPGNNGVYEKAIAWCCKNILRFRGSDGQILEYPIVNRNATQYNDGETSKQQLTLGTAKHLIYIPFDSDTIKLDNGARFLLDKNRENPTAFKLTQVDSTSYAFGEIGLLQWTVVEDLFVPERDNKQLMIADDKKISGSADTQGGDFWG